MGELCGKVKGMRVLRGTPRILHLLFADDSLIFGEVTALGASNLMGILDDYARCSGQVISFEKSKVFFSSNVSKYNRADVGKIFGVSCVDNLEKYIGLPSVGGRNKKQAFATLKD